MQSAEHVEYIQSVLDRVGVQSVLIPADATEEEFRHLCAELETRSLVWYADQLARGNPIHVVTDQWRTPTYAPDLASGIERMVRFNKTGLYHVSGRDLLTVFDFARAVADAFDLDASRILPTDSSRSPGALLRPLRTGFIILKAETELGYKPRPLRDALRHLGSRLGLPVTNFGF